MNLKLAYDVETTGIPLYKEPSSDPRQPHIVQLAGKVIDVDTGAVHGSIDFIIRPDGWTIPAEVTEIHGLTTEHALRVGVPESIAVQALLALWSTSSERFAHNESFDARLVRIAIKRLLGDDALADDWKAGPAYCTQRNSVNLCQVPPSDAMLARNNRSWKTPSLAEAYQHVTNQVHVGSHRAMADVDAAIAVYFGIQKAQAGAAVVDTEITA